MLRIAMLIYPDMFTQDLIGPQTLLQRLDGADLFYIAKTRAPVVSDLGIPFAARHDFDSCPKDLDVLFVPGGLRGTTPAMGDAETLDFLADRGGRARFVTSVCTGSLILGAAGLLTGYKATSYWMVRDLLPLFGAELVKERVVIDRNRITGGGVTSGIDFGLTLARLLAGEEVAQTLQLFVEYDPHPPFDAGAPERAPGPIVAHLCDMRGAELTAARAAAEAAARKLAERR